MHQIFQDFGSGKTLIIDAPVPSLKEGHVLIDTSRSLISSGTERMLIDFGRANMISKARQQPQKVNQVLQKLKTDGLAPTIEAVTSKLSEPFPLGYSNVGVVSKSASAQFKPGDRVVSNGFHAEVVCVPANLCAHIPANVSDESAAFTVIGAIAMQGIRLASLSIGETVAVFGVGLIGLITVQLLLAQGCKVLALDFDAKKLKMAEAYGATTFNLSGKVDAVAYGMAFSSGLGVDAAIITAATKSNEPISQAAQMSRKRGRIILVGVVGLSINRSDFYKKELTFQVSCSYGPGRYDPMYEDKGIDYPFGFVRWTEQRNFGAVLDVMSNGSLIVDGLISHRFDLHSAADAYEVMSSGREVLGIMMEYNSDRLDRHQTSKQLAPPSLKKTSASKVKVGMLGAGNFGVRKLIPAFKKAGAELVSIASSQGSSAAIHGGRAGFLQATSDSNAVIKSSSLNTIVVSTRHDSHSEYAAQALNANKNVYLEKPLAIDSRGLELVKQAYSRADCHLMVGFNRRFSPHSKKMKHLLDEVSGPKVFNMTMNAGFVPPEHWTQDPQIGGGRVIGEACHYIDLMRFFAGSEISSVFAKGLTESDKTHPNDDIVIITLGFADGSIGTINYLSNGGADFPKERIEVFVSGRTLRIENFIRMRGYNWPGFKKYNLWAQDKGHTDCVAAFVRAIENGQSMPIPAVEIFEVAQITLDAAAMLRE